MLKFITSKIFKVGLFLSMLLAIIVWTTAVLFNPLTTYTYLCAGNTIVTGFYIYYLCKIKYFV